MQTERACRSGLAVQLGQKTDAAFAFGGDLGRLPEELLQFGMLVSPGLDTDGGRQRGFFALYGAYAKSRGQVRRQIYRPVHHVADLDRPVAARAEQIDRSRPHQRAYLVLDGRTALVKEALDGIERGGTQL